jgi:hypothetical protein
VEISFSYFKKLFHDYASSFLQGKKREQDIITAKIDHTFRVVDNVCCIVQHEKFEKLEQETVLLAALFHDIGRFSQFAQFGTFLDQESVNHARRGVQVLKNNKVLDGLPRSQKKLVLAAVELHNRRDLPQTISHQLTIICNILRDSDKIDIFKVLLDHLESPKPNDPTMVLNVAPHPDYYSRKIYESIMEGMSCAYGDMKWTHDFRLMLASWVPLLNFASSYRLLEQSGDYIRLFQQLPQTKKIKELKNKLDECFI